MVAGGKAYVVEPKLRHLIVAFGANICWAECIDTHGFVVFHNGVQFTAYGAGGQTTRRLSWDGIRVHSLEFPRLSGEFWSPVEDRWVSFTLDLRTREASGGSYVGPD